MQPGERLRAGIHLNAIGAVIAGTAIALLGVRALVRFDDSWDGTSYHLVFAAFRAHILTFSDFEPLPNMVAGYHSYPPLLDIVRGFVWRITGSILILQLFNLIAIVALTSFWRRHFDLSFRWIVVTILSIPLIQIGATTLYVDTITNCLFVVALSILAAAFVDRRPLHRSEVIISLSALALSANVKPQFMVVGTVALMILCIYQLSCLKRQGNRADLRFFLLPAAVACLLVPAVALSNVLTFGNPVYPLAIAIFDHNLPGLFPASALWRGPDYLSQVPQPVRWLASILEYRAFEGSDIPTQLTNTTPFLSVLCRLSTGRDRLRFAWGAISSHSCWGY